MQKPQQQFIMSPMESPFEKINKHEPTYFYITSRNVYLTIAGETYTDDMFEYFDKEEKMWKESQPRYTFTELMKIFPEAISPARRGLKAKIIEYKKYIRDINQRQENYGNNVINKAHFSEQHFLKEESDKFFNEQRDSFTSKIKTAMFCLSHLDEIEGKMVVDKKDRITNDDIIRAKEIPITNFYTDKLTKKGNIATGKCPFHNERTASFTIYTKQNSWYCFGCNSGGSVVDYIMKERGLNFLSAVKFLIKK